MKVTKVIHHGQTRYRVNDPHGPDGKRQRKFFDTREAAENYVKERTDDSKAFGIHFTIIPTQERAVIVYGARPVSRAGAVAGPRRFRFALSQRGRGLGFLRGLGGFGGLQVQGALRAGLILRAQPVNDAALFLGGAFRV